MDNKDRLIERLSRQKKYFIKNDNLIKAYFDCSIN